MGMDEVSIQLKLVPPSGCIRFLLFIYLFLILVTRSQPFFESLILTGLLWVYKWFRSPAYVSGCMWLMSPLNSWKGDRPSPPHEREINLLLYLFK